MQMHAILCAIFKKANKSRSGEYIEASSIGSG